MVKKALRLITEEINSQNLDFVMEEKDSEKSFKLVGPFMQYDIKNNNNRIYPHSLLKREADRYTKEEISRRNSLGQYKHETSPFVDREKACILVESLEDDGKNSFIGTAKVLKNLPMGRLVHNLLLERIPIAISSRALGTCNPMTGIVNDDLKICAFDILDRLNPGGPDCFVNGVLEHKEYLIQGDIIVEQAIDRFQETLDKTGSKYLTEAIQKFISDLKKI